ncbi:antifungal protein ginkbilobin-like protein [Punica granatum]|uniref:Antifungal protein ginkbilobin-like protein n=1 Tax=Punica granatum TaxID=22663 RepID=A0A6P8C223_PUNGR|nr:antifungal protein ginkbilobin-like protein [Punica granatum]XP_031378242.1 antifungal protein ginkbilobin-like protein [Punica granatum]
MASREKIAIIVALVLFCICFEVAKCFSQRLYLGAPNTTLLSRFCSNEKTGDGSRYPVAVGFMLLEILNTAMKGHNYYTTTHFFGAIVYGHGACNGQLEQLNCNDCLNAAEEALACDSSVGAQVQLQDCRIRYENYPFIE